MTNMLQGRGEGAYIVTSSLYSLTTMRNGSRSQRDSITKWKKDNKNSALTQKEPYDIRRLHGKP